LFSEVQAGIENNTLITPSHFKRKSQRKNSPLKRGANFSRNLFRRKIGVCISEFEIEIVNKNKDYTPLTPYFREERVAKSLV